jgi:hypothetical protein
MSDAITDPTDLNKTEPCDLPRDGFCTEETHWGYIVRSNHETGSGLLVTHSLSLLSGAALLAAALGMWLIPGMLFGADALFMRLFATIIFIAASALLLWYSSRGTISEIQIDNARGEIREVVRNHTGRMSLLACYSFDSIGNVDLEPALAENAAASLVLRYRNSAETVEVAYGREGALSSLRDRISRDVIVGATALAKRKAKVNAFKLAA